MNAEHTRSILNVRDLVTYCNNMGQVYGWKITCTSDFLANLTLRQTISLVRKHDVLVCMNGGDCAHGLHLPHGRTVVETVPYGFERAPDPWLNLYRSRMVPVLKHRRVVLCDNNRTSTRHYVNGWNQPGILPPMRFLEVIRSIVEKNAQEILPLLREWRLLKISRCQTQESVQPFLKTSSDEFPKRYNFSRCSCSESSPPFNEFGLIANFRNCLHE